jgi:hypothetical protein
VIDLLPCTESASCLVDGILPFWAQIFVARTANPVTDRLARRAKTCITQSCSKDNNNKGARAKLGIALRSIISSFLDNAILHSRQKFS